MSCGIDALLSPSFRILIYAVCMDQEAEVEHAYSEPGPPTLTGMLHRLFLLSLKAAFLHRVHGQF